MTSLRKYASRRHTAYYYAPGFDPTVPTGTPVPEPVPSPAPSETRNFGAPIEDQINEPLGVVGEVAREYLRIRRELGPKPKAVAPALTAKALRRKKKQEEAKEAERARAIFWAQYHKLMDQKAYVDSVLEYLDETGFYDTAHGGQDAGETDGTDEDDDSDAAVDAHDGIDNSDLDLDVGDTFPEHNQFVQGSSKGGPEGYH